MAVGVLTSVNFGVTSVAQLSLTGSAIGGSGVASGTPLVVIVHCSSVTGTLSFTDSQSNTYTSYGPWLTGGSGTTCRMAAFSLTLPAGLSSTDTFTASTTVSGQITFEVFTAANWNGSMDVAPAANLSVTAGTAWTAAPLTPSVGTTAVLFAAIGGAAATLGTVTGFTQMTRRANGSRAMVALYQQIASSSLLSPSGTISASNPWIGVSLSLAQTTGVTGTFAATEGNDTLASSGTETITGTLASTDANDTLAATGTSTNGATGTFAATEANDTLAGAGTEKISGTLASAEGSDTLVAAGTSTNGITGTLAATEANDTLVGAGAETVTGVFASTEGLDTLAAVAVEKMAGTLAASEGSDTLVGSGVEKMTGTLAATEGADTLVAIGTTSSTVVLVPAPRDRTIATTAVAHSVAAPSIAHRVAAPATAHSVAAAAQNHGASGVSSSVTYAAEKLGAGGWVTGLAISPDGLTRIVRCDTLGGWRWSPTANQWVSMTTATSLSAPFNALDGAEGVFAIAAANDRAYMATAGAIFTSTDKGATWATSLASGPATSANVSGVKRYSNHMAIDPNDSLTCLYGTVNQGVYYTRNGGTSWTQVPSASVPIGVDGAGTPGTGTFGVLSVLIDGSGNWYASPFGSGLYQSTNHGTSWAKISSDTDFVAAMFMDLGPNGDIVVCGTTSATTAGIAAANIKVMRYRSSAWTNITPTGTARAWKAVAFDPTSAGRVIVQADGGYTQLSTDYGTTWANQVRSFASPSSDVPWLAASNNGDGTQSYFTTIGGLQFDPVVSGRVWMSQGIGVWYASPSSNTIQWNAQSRGIEQIVVNDVTVPPGGRPVVSCWDRPVFIVGETTGGGTYPYQYHPDNGTLSSGWHADYSASTPTWLAASVWDRSGFATEHPCYSTDGGLTWTNFATIPSNGGAYFAGSIHVGAPGHMIWVSAGSKGASYSTDSGTTWTAVAIPGVTMSALNTQSYFYYRRPIASEKTAGSADTFYAFVTSKGVYRSTDVGANWTQRCDNTQFAGNDWSQMAYLKSVPGQAGHLFITPGWQGAGGGAEALGLPFKRSTDGGVTWTTVSTISSVRGFDFGAAAPGTSYPAVYAIGYVGGVKGAYRSIDNCASWTLLSTQPNGTVDFIRNIGASQDTYGKHWITTAGSGLIVGTAGTSSTAAVDPELSAAVVNHTVEA